LYYHYHYINNIKAKPRCKLAVTWATVLEEVRKSRHQYPDQTLPYSFQQNCTGVMESTKDIWDYIYLSKPYFLFGKGEA
jgi:hypothetical protein